MTILISFSSYAEVSCVDLRFEAQDVLCTREAKAAQDAAGTPGFMKAIKAKMSCLDNFSTSCENSVKQTTEYVCDDIKFEAQDFICTLESDIASNLAGTPEFMNAIKAKMTCLNSFLQSCLNL